MNTIESADIERPVGTNIWRVSGGGILVLTASAGVYLTVRHGWTSALGALTADSDMRIVRIA